jgi:uncharacterized protein YcbK (DUF882 family)
VPIKEFSLIQKQKMAAFAAVMLCAWVSGAKSDDAASPIAFVQTIPASADSPSEQVDKKKARNYLQKSHLGVVQSGNAGNIVKQTGSVATGCLPARLTHIIRNASLHFGSAAVITSGYRSGRHSYHGKCMAADVQIAGVSPAALARYFRAQPGVGGVGTYGHTRSVHVDVAGRVYTWYHGRRGRSAG